MKLLIFPLFTILILNLTACSRHVKTLQVIPGKTLLNEAIQSLGEPLYKIKSQNSADIMIYNWRDIGLQANGEKILSVHRSPAGHEKNLQHWHHYLHGEKTSFTPIRDEAFEKIWMLNVPQKHLNIIYDENKNEVIKINLYAKD